MLDGTASLTAPHNAEVEQALLAVLFYSSKAYDTIAGTLRPEHFYYALHGRIYEACGRMIDRGEKPSPVALKEAFLDDPAFHEAGGTAYLVEIAAALVSVRNAAPYAAQIIDHWKLRRLIERCEAAIAEAGRGSLDPRADALIRDTEQALCAIAADRAGAEQPIASGAAAETAIALAEAAWRNAGRITGVPTGLTHLDGMLGGLQAGHLDIVAGRPSMGKTLLADTIAVAAARAFAAAGSGRSVLVFSLEMTAAELAVRRLAALTGIEIQRIQKGQLDRTEFLRLEEARQELAALPLLTDDGAGLTVPELRSRARRVARREGGLGLLVVDHIGLLDASGEARRNGETAAVTEITKGLKLLARELDVPVLALSQLNRDLEKRDDKRPMLADLRQSGSIEQDADVVMFVFREEYYLSRAEPLRHSGESDAAYQTRVDAWAERLAACRNTADILIAKHRNGPIGTAHAFFDGARGLFTNLQGSLPS